MSKYVEVDDSIQKLFDEVLDNTSIPQWVVFELRAYDNQKEICLAKKVNELYESLTDGLNFIILVNEEILGQLDDTKIKIVFDECLAGVVVSDKDTVSYDKPNFTTYRGVLEKYGHAEIISIKESIKSLYDAKKQKEDEEKAAKKGKRGRKKSFE